MPPNAYAICSGAALTPAQQAVYRSSWAAGLTREPAEGVKVIRNGKPTNPPPPPARSSHCVHLGAEIRREVCQFCGNRGKMRAVHSCAIWGEATPIGYRAGQPETDCRSCPQYEAAPMLEGHLPAIPAGFNLPMPAGLTPLPAGRDSFNGREWRQLPAEHQAYYRALKRFRDHGEHPAPPQATPPATSTEYEIPKDSTPFCDPTGRPVHLGAFGQAASAFLVLGGPSLVENDLGLLNRRGIFTLAVNNAATVIRPNAMVFVDKPCKFHDCVWRDPGVIKFVRRSLLARGLRTRNSAGEFSAMKTSEGRDAFPRDMPAVVAWNHNATFEPSRWLQEPSINWGNDKKSVKRFGGKYPQVLNSMFASLKLLYALGFRVVYLLGCDFQMRDEQPYAFGQTKSPGGVRSNNGTYEKLRHMLGLLAPHFSAAGFHVFNCNPNSGLTLFPLVPFREAVETATRDFAETSARIRGDGWYNNYAGD